MFMFRIMLCSGAFLSADFGNASGLLVPVARAEAAEPSQQARLLRTTFDTLRKTYERLGPVERAAVDQAAAETAAQLVIRLSAVDLEDVPDRVRGLTERGLFEIVDPYVKTSVELKAKAKSAAESVRNASDKEQAAEQALPVIARAHAHALFTHYLVTLADGSDPSLVDQTMRYLDDLVDRGGGLASTPVWMSAHLSAGRTALRRGDHAGALREFLPLAEKGNAEAQFRLGVLYATGAGVSRDDVVAAKWFSSAARQGDAGAQYNLGLYHERGWGVPQSFEAAAEWYFAAAEQGHAEAQTNLGSLYLNGWGVDKDEARALELYRRAAQQGETTAQHNLGVMFAAGLGVAPDLAEAGKWFRRAAGQGHAEAQVNLGIMYAEGFGVSRDLVRANMWLRLSVDRLPNGERKDVISGAIAQLESEMSTPQVAEATRRKFEWETRDARAEMDAWIEDMRQAQP